MSYRLAQLSVVALACALVALPSYAAPTPGSTPATDPSPSPSVASPATPAPAYAMKVRVELPPTPTSPVILVYSGLPAGAEIHASAGRRQGVQAETDGAGVADSRGSAAVQLFAPNGRWPSGATYRYGTMGFVDSPRWEQTVTGRFSTPTWPAAGAPTATASPTSKPTKAPTKTTTRKPDRQGGLAKTGF